MMTLLLNADELLRGRRGLGRPYSAGCPGGLLRPPLGATAAEGFIKLAPGTRADGVQFGVKTADLGVQFEERHAVSRNQTLRTHAVVVLRAGGLHANTSRGKIRARIALQVKQIQSWGLHGAIITRNKIELTCGF